VEEGKIPNCDDDFSTNCLNPKWSIMNWKLQPFIYFEFIPLVKNPFTLSYATRLSSGIDLKAYLWNDICNPYDIWLKPGERVVVDTGFKVKIHPDYEGLIRSRSGLAAKNGIMVLNSPGTIDADYDGPVKIILLNTSSNGFKISHGDKIAQFVCAPVVREPAYMQAIPVERGEGGFGSTGV
jgi:dUTP pyrophosphatase